MNFDKIEIRSKSNILLNAHGIFINENLPYLEDELYLKTKEQVINRAICLNVVVASSFNANIKNNSINYLKDNNLVFFLTNKELDFLNNQISDTNYFQAQQECLYTLGWILGLIEDINISQYVPLELAMQFPNLLKQESPFTFQNKSVLREKYDVVKMLDFYYCLDWYLTNSILTDKPISKKIVAHSAIRERRRALEWVLKNENWDNVSMDT